MPSRGALLLVALVFVASASSLAAPLSASSSKNVRSYADVAGAPYKVSYDHRAFTVAGERVLIQSGSIHYPRSTPDMWPRLMQLSKDNGLNAIETYAFWSIHEPVRGQWDFSSPQANLTGFLREAQNAGLFVILRLGPYVCAEWNYGGVPVWLRDVPGIEFRTYNDAWMGFMKLFMERVLAVVEPFLARNGGPIIIAQVENEYGNIDEAYGKRGQQYIQWSADTANAFNIEVPWIMCQQDDAPANVVNTCNGFYCDDWIEKHRAARPSQPAAFTENWPGWFQAWGEPVPHRPVEDVSFSIARWVARGGTLFNYYMMHGGTNFGRTVGGPNIVTSYDYDVAINEYGRAKEPKYSHSAAMHAVLAEFASLIVGTEVPAPLPLGAGLEAHVYGEPDCVGAQCCLAFVSNTLANATKTVTLHAHSFSVAAWSVSLVDCSAQAWNVLHNTATIHGSTVVRAATTKAAFTSASAVPSVNIGWLPETALTEPFKLVAERPLEQIDTTKDASDYLFYATEVLLSKESAAAGVAPLLLVAQDYFYVFLDDVFKFAAAGTDEVTAHALDVRGLAPGAHTLKVMCMTQGLVNYGKFVLDTWKRGVALGSANFSTVVFDGYDVSHQQWYHRPALTGELRSWHEPSIAAHLPWRDVAADTPTRPLTWWRLVLPVVDRSLSRSYALDMSSMGKGQVWVNGHSLGRFWDRVAVPSKDGGDCSVCDYRGAFSPTKCRTGCGEPSQSLYHVPVAWLDDAANTVIVFQETAGGVPANVRLVQVHSE